jgi:hypothetical protein
MELYMNTNDCLEIKDGIYLGIDKGFWAILAKGGVICQMEKEADFFRVISLLESPFSETVDLIESFRRLHQVELAFPFDSLVKTGLNCMSDYWAGLALSWLKEMPPQIKKKLLNEITEVSRAKWASQKTRMVAKRELKVLSKQDSQ